MNGEAPEIEEGLDDERLYCDCYGVEVDSEESLVPPLCNACSARLN